MSVLNGHIWHLAGEEVGENVVGNVVGIDVDGETVGGTVGVCEGGVVAGDLVGADAVGPTVGDTVGGQDMLSQHAVLQAAATFSFEQNPRMCTHCESGSTLG